MMKALLKLRLQAMFAGFMRQSRRKNKRSPGMIILFAVLYLYVVVVVVGMMCMMFGQLAQPYHAMGLDWLYFAMAGLMGLGFAIFGGVFTTQSQLYDAKDNDLMLSMPITPAMILISRMIPLLLLNLLFVGMVMIPAAVMYGILVEFSFLNFLIQLLAVGFVCLLAQALCCLLGWGLHWVLSKMNKSFASLLYMVVFLVVYFSIYSQAGNLLNTMAAEGEAIASALRSWVWILYALGRGCSGALLYFLIFAAVSAAAFVLACWFLAKTFLKAATFRRSGGRKKLNLSSVKMANAVDAIVFKEWRHFLGSPVYLTNMGVGILLTVALAVAGIVMKGKILDMVAAMGMDLREYYPLVICGLLASLTSMSFVSAPSVSLEGKNLWILKSMPVSAKKIIVAKLKFHCLLTTPVAVLTGLTLSVWYSCGAVEILLSALVPGALSVLCGLVGMLFGLKWVRLDWLSEAYPCKQGAAVGITMFSMMGVPVVLALCFFGLNSVGVPVIAFLAMTLALLAGICAGLYRLLMSWGVRKWDSL